MLGGLERRTISVRGAVQGVGLRPYVYGLARRLGLAGFVRNRMGLVDIEVEGPAGAIEQFLSELTTCPPPLARIDELLSAPKAPIGDALFRIVQSESGESSGTVVPADVATCAACLRELFDPTDRRYRYAFLNCTNCGPRLTIIDALPYDRERTAMAGFPMCAACRAEYEDPADRRFHAQPTACCACGPRLSVLDAAGDHKPVSDPITAAIDELSRGRIVAIKGIGGFHLACDATRDDTVSRLRCRKHRDEKPFAVMFASIDIVDALCVTSTAERATLQSPERPIVLLKRRSTPCHDAPRIARAVAPDSPATLGVLLPYAPVHHLLFREGRFTALVMTSGNRADEPIAYNNDDFVGQLRGIADVFLTHDRPIRTRCDDSVLRSLAAGGTLGTVVPLRRSRGYAPLPFALKATLTRATLAAGGDSKSTFALGEGDRAVVSHHLGDLEHRAAYEAYVDAIAHYERLYRMTPLRIAHDLHLDYASTRYAHDRARGTAIELLPVQHHHAHMASCMLENGLTGSAIGVCFDGAGLGTDGTVWGGEFLVGDCRRVVRAAWIRPVPLPGGDRAAREGWRMAVSHLTCAGEDVMASELVGRIGEGRVSAVLQLVQRRIQAPLTSSAGRLFDAVASLAGVCDSSSFDGQAAMRLESLAMGLSSEDAYAFGTHEMPMLDAAPVIRAVQDDRRRGVDVRVIARRFHAALARAIVEACARISSSEGIDAVVLSGGVFSNAILTSEVVERLATRGLRVYRHRHAPPNDGGLSLGQLAVAAAQDRKE